MSNTRQFAPAKSQSKASARAGTSLRPAAWQQETSQAQLRMAQSVLGNQGVLQRMEAGLRLNDVNDPSEREADRVADAVMKPHARAPSVSSLSSAALIRRKCASCEEDEGIRLQRKEQAPSQGAASSASFPIPAIVGRVLSSPGQPLGESTRAFMESRMGRDFGRVRIHTGAEAEQSALAVNARAYAVGRELVFGPNHYAPHSHEGLRVLAHELAHVVQQGQSGTLHRSTPAAPVFGPGTSAGTSPARLARLPLGTDMPLVLQQDQDAAGLTPQQRTEFIAWIDRRLRYLETPASAAAPSEIKITGLAAATPESERATLFGWRSKLVAGSGVLVAVGIPRNSAAPSPPPQVSTAPPVAPDTSPGTSRGSHAAPPAFLAPKPQPRTLDDLIRAGNAVPGHAKQPGAFSTIDPALRAFGDPRAESPAPPPSNVRGAHAGSPAGPAPQKQPRTFEDAIAASNADPHSHSANTAQRVDVPSLSPADLKAVLRKPGEVRLPNGEWVVIPPKPPGELVEDVKVEGQTYLKATISGPRAGIVRILNSELRRLEGIEQLCSSAAQRFLDEWLRRPADWAAGTGPPSGAIWAAVRRNIQQSRDAIRDGNLQRAVEMADSASAALRSAQADWGRYRDHNLGGAENLQAAAETTRDAAKYTLIGLATVASGGAAALLVATAGGIAIDLTDAATRAALGEPVNWTQVTVDVAVQIVTARFGGVLSGKLVRAVEGSAPAAVAAAGGRGLERSFVVQAVESLLAGAESRTLGVVTHDVLQSALQQGKPMTWEQVIDEIVKQVEDPKSLLIDLILSTGRGIRASQARPKVKPGPAREAHPESSGPAREKHPESSGKDADVIDLAEYRRQRAAAQARAQKVAVRGKVAAGAENEPPVAVFSTDEIHEEFEAATEHRGQGDQLNKKDVPAENIRETRTVRTTEYDPRVGDSALLGDRLTRAGMPKPGEGHQAHHIVPSNEPKAERLRDFLWLKGFRDINDADNGVWLPTHSQTENPGAEFKHEFTFDNPSFEGKYFERLEEILMKDPRIGPARIRLKLRSIRTFLRDGKLPPPNL